MRGRLLLRALVVLLGAALGVLLLRTFVGNLYRVDSGSMQPTLYGDRVDGERVLVLYGGAPFERFELVVLRRPGEQVPAVKRVVGLPGEGVQVSGGDLFVGGERLPPEAPRPRPVLLFDDQRHAFGDYFYRDEGDPGPWTEAAGILRLDLSALPDAQSRWHYHKDLNDGFLDREGKRVSGKRQVRDGILSLRVRPHGTGGRVLLELSEQGDRFRVSLPVGSGEALLERLHPSGRAELLANAPFALEGARPALLRFENVDNHLLLAVDGEPVLSFNYGENRPHPDLPAGRSPLPRLSFGGDQGLTASFDRVRVLRDLHWISLGEHGVDRPLSLAQGEYFVLGDHSAESEDGRTWGPVTEGDLLGRPWAVLWPFQRARRLRPIRD